jgi:Fusaric acid resistance protein family
LRSNWETLAAVAESKNAHDRIAIAGLMQHRLALLAARVTVVPAEARTSAANLQQLRAALSLIDLRQASLALSRRTRAAIDAFLANLASACRAHPIGRLPDELVGQLDRTIASALQEAVGEHRGDALVGLTAIRIVLFPGAVPYQPSPHEQGRAAA